MLNYQNHPLPEPFNGWIGELTGGSMVVTAGRSSWSPGVLLQLINELAAALGTQVQVETGQRMVYDLRCRLFEHLQALGLHHHITTNTGDAVYRIDVDAVRDRKPGDERHLPARDLGGHARRDVRHPAAGST